MKKLIIILLLSPLFGYSQIDSAAVKINLSIQARDLEYYTPFISFREEYDELFDAIKLKARVQNPPTNTTLVALDSIQVKTWLLVSNFIRKDYIAIQAGIFSRLDATLRAKNNAYLTRLLNEANAYDTNLYLNIRQAGRNRYKK